MENGNNSVECFQLKKKCGRFGEKCGKTQPKLK
jgi:hypothetical protein